MTPGDLIRDTALRLREAGVPDPVTDSALILSSLCHVPPLSLRLDYETVLPNSVLDRFELLVLRRLQRKPLQYILAEAPFFGRFFYVDPNVLIPRPETALLCEWALEKLAAVQAPRILDLCTGSGCLGISVSLSRPDAGVVCSDLSESALAVARKNADLLGADVVVRKSNLFSDLPPDAFDLILSNPPYIPTAELPSLQPEVRMEPSLALDGGPDGLSIYRRIVSDAPAFLKPGGILMMELGWDESDSVSVLLQSGPFSRIEIRKDLAGINRMISAVREA